MISNNNNLKIKRAVEKANICKKSIIVNTLIKKLPKDLINNTRSDELATILELMDQSYKHGQNSIIKKYQRENKGSKWTNKRI